MTNISWTDKTWNPFVGCSKVSEGCANCYAIQRAKQNEGCADALINEGQNPGRLAYYIGLTKKTKNGTEWTGKVNFVPEALDVVLNRKKPTKWFVNSMSDLFHESISFDDIDKVMTAIALTPHHIYQVLTKRPERMLEYFTNHKISCGCYSIDPSYLPFSNLWLGVTVEDQKQVDRRIPYLLKTPAAVRFLSCEPLLEEIVVDPLGFQTIGKDKGIDWVIIGGESGHKARPFHLEWAKSLIEQCQEAGVKVWFKQAGSNPYYQGKPLKLKSKNGTDLSELPEFCQIQEMPN